MPWLASAVFAAVYIVMAVGRVPGLRLDRTGAALTGAVILVASGVLPADRLPDAIDFPTVLLLFGLMVLSARFAALGFYDAAASWIARHEGSPRTLLALTVAVGGGLSAILVNDVVVFAMTPLLCAGVRARGLDPRPFLIALAGASNAGSAATLIGNPQNILIGQVGALDFWSFAAVCVVPSVLSMAIVYAVVGFLWRESLAPRGPSIDFQDSPRMDRRQLFGAGLGVGVLLVLFATELPRESAALLVASAMLFSRRFASRDMLVTVDWPLLVLFAALFVVNDAFAATGLPDAFLGMLAEQDWLPDRLHLMAPLALVLSNTIGNVPAVVMLLEMWPELPRGALHGLGLLSTLAGNFLLVGSIANLIVVERAATVGVRLSFADHARSGIPIALLSIAVAVAWLNGIGAMTW